MREAKDWREREQNAREAREFHVKAASGLLSTARSQQQWDTYKRALAREGGVPDYILGLFGEASEPARSRTG